MVVVRDRGASTHAAISIQYCYSSRHQEQYAAQRKYVKGKEAALADGECVIYEDFVNFYQIDGTKTYNLVFTIVTMEGGVRKVRWLNNYCNDKDSKKADAYFVRDVWDHHLKSKKDGGSGELDEFDHIIRSGESGPHFHNYKTIWFESRISEVILTRTSTRAHIPTHTHSATQPIFFV